MTATASQQLTRLWQQSLEGTGRSLQEVTAFLATPDVPETRPGYRAERCLLGNGWYFDKLAPFLGCTVVLNTTELPEGFEEEPAWRLSEAIKHALHEKGLKAEDFARYVRKGLSTIRRWLRADMPFEPGSLQTLGCLGKLFATTGRLLTFSLEQSVKSVDSPAAASTGELVDKSIRADKPVDTRPIDRTVLSEAIAAMVGRAKENHRRNKLEQVANLQLLLRALTGMTTGKYAGNKVLAKEVSLMVVDTGMPLRFSGQVRGRDGTSSHVNCAVTIACLNQGVSSFKLRTADSKQAHVLTSKTWPELTIDLVGEDEKSSGKQ